MYESIISACRVMDTFGLPRAVADFETDSFVFANNSFLRVAGLNEHQLARQPLSGIVKVHIGSLDAGKTGQLIPITVESYDQGFLFRGHAVFGSDRLVYLMVPLFGDPSADFELGRSVGKEQERQRRVRYVHENLVPQVESALLGLQGVRGRLREENHSEATLEKIERSLTDLLQAMTGEVIEEPARRATMKSV